MKAKRKRSRAPKKPVLRAIHERIKELRLAHGMSQAELGSRCGVGKDAVSHWELGKSSPTSQRLPIVAEAFGVTVGDLYAEAA